MTDRRTISNQRRCGLALLAALLCCADCSLPSLRSGVTPQAPAMARQAAKPAGGGAPFLYVGGPVTSMYKLGSSEPLHSTAENSYVIDARIALDGHGDLCEANGNPSDQQTYVYNARTLELERTLYGGGSYPSMAADRSGYIYVSTGGPSIYVFAPGCAKVINVMRRCVVNTTSLVFDQSGSLYAGNEGDLICVYAPTQEPGHMKFVRKIDEGIHGPVILAIGPDGELFVSNEVGMSSGNFVSVFPPGASKPARRITKGINLPTALRADSKGRLYVGNVNLSSRYGWVSVYSPGGTRPIRRIDRSKNWPVAFALDASDDLYVANLVVGGGSVAVYSPGGAKLLRTITKGVNSPRALLIGSP